MRIEDFKNLIELHRSSMPEDEFEEWARTIEPQNIIETCVDLHNILEGLVSGGDEKEEMLEALRAMPEKDLVKYQGTLASLIKVLINY